MRERIAGLIGEEAAREATIGTFHAICARILRRDGEAIGLTRSFTIYDRADQVALVKSVLKRLDLDEKRFSPAGMLAWIGQRKDELADVATATQAGGELLRRDRRPRVRRLPAPAGRGRRGRLRRPADAVGDPVRAASRRAGPLPGALAADPGRRVPGHEPRPVPHLPPPGGQAPQPRRGRRRRPEHLLLARRGPAQHPRLRGRLPRRQGREARAELPLDPDDPRRGARGRQPQRRAQGQEAVDRSRQPARRSPCSTPTTSTRRPSSSRARSRSSSAARAAAGMAALLTSRADDEDGSLRYGDIAVTYRINAQSRVLRGVVHALRDPVPAGRRHALLRAPRGQGRARPTSAWRATRPTAWRWDGSSTSRRAGSARRRSRSSAPGPSRAASACGRRSRRPGENPNLAPRSRAQLGVFAELMRGLDGHGCHRAAVGDLRRGARALRPPGGHPGRHRRGRGALGERPGAAKPRRRVRRDRSARGPRPLPGGGRAGQRPGRAGGRARPGDAHHAPRREGARVPGRLHRRHGGGPAAAPARAGGRARAGGGATPGVRGHDSRQGPALPRPRPPSVDVRRRRPVGSVALPGRAAGGAARRRALGRARSGAVVASWPRGTDDDGGWLPSGYRSPVSAAHQRAAAADHAARPVGADAGSGRSLDAARERVAATTYEGGAVDLGIGTFSAPGAPATRWAPRRIPPGRPATA